MLLWIGAILCFIAYGIESSTYEDPAEDNVSGLMAMIEISIYTKLYNLLCICATCAYIVKLVSMCKHIRIFYFHMLQISMF